MNRRRALLVDAFTIDPYTGNPAGVVPEASDLDADQMQAIARELGASETAFLEPAETALRRIRYFTPTTEVDLCGHATVASLAYLHQSGTVEPGAYEIETNVGVLETEIDEDGRVWMTQDVPTVEEVDRSYSEVATALGVDEDALREVGVDLPLATASTGFPFLMVPVAYLEDLGSADPDLEATERLAESVDADGVYAFTFDTLDARSTVHGRAFVPGAGIPEDPVTGTASGAAGAYLRHFGAFEEMPESLFFEQGHYVDRPGRVVVRAGETVEVGGRAAVTLDGTIAEPATDEDEILEV